MLNIDLAVAVVLLFHFQVTECHNQEQCQAKSEQGSFYLCAVFDEVAGVEENERELLERYGGYLTVDTVTTHSFIRADLLKLLTCFLC